MLVEKFSSPGQPRAAPTPAVTREAALRAVQVELDRAVARVVELRTRLEIEDHRVARVAAGLEDPADDRVAVDFGAELARAQAEVERLEERVLSVL